MRGLPLTLKPAYFPVDSTLADCCTIVLQQSGQDPADYMDRIFTAVWVDQANIADESVISDRLDQSGFDAAEVIANAKASSIQAKRDAYTEEAATRDAVGVPAFVLNGEVFWGQDRIEFIDHALASCRSPYQPAEL